MDLDSVADELYGLRPEQFTAARNERVAAARTAGDRKLAEQISGLRRPSLSAWAGNLLVRERPDEVKPLIQLGEALRSAHHDLDGDQLRRLTQQQRAVVRALSQQAGDLAAAAGHPLADDAQREVQDTLQAVLADPDAAREWAAGRLAKPIGPAVGFPAVGPAAPSRRNGAPSAAKKVTPPAKTPPSRAKTPPSPAKKPPASGDGESAADARRRERLAQARQESEDAKGDLLARETAAEAAERAVQDAKERTEALHQRVTELTEELKALTEKLKAAEEEHRQARADERGAREREREAGRGVRAARTHAGKAAAQVERLAAKASGKKRG
ncbi:hypothetical protein ACFVYF_24440 [Streptomyces sp. NPDC058274]|uniref:hypothetical protein n=1 Tax=Streptomyces sp. NPDC058274 TaxID=3346416 RepID=UPI0036E5949F